jgi:hypothetical protein
MKDLIAANLALRVLALLPRADSMCPRKSITNGASICSRFSLDGVTLNRILANSKSS